ncbi:MAG: hypothetical protein ACI8P9_004619 [Parasphingorhabdus sp.]
MKRIYTASNLPDAFMLRDMLRDSGIAAEVFNQHSSGAMGEIPATEVWPEIWIHEELHVEFATKLMNNYEVQRNSLAQVDRLCKECGEQNPGNFDFCWQCNTAIYNGGG